MRQLEISLKRQRNRARVATFTATLLPAFWKKRKWLAAERSLRDDEIISRSNLRLKSVLRETQVTSPYYRALVGKFPLNYEVKLDDYPIVYRNNIAANLADFIARRADNSMLAEGPITIVRTSGSSGVPVTTLHHNGSGSNDVFYSRLFKRHGIPDSGDYIDLGLRFPGEPLLTVRPAVGVYRAWCLSRYQPEFDAVIEDEYLSVSKHIQPVFIIGAPSRIVKYIDVLAAHHMRIYPRAVFTTFEYLNDSDRKSIEDYFKCKTIAVYGCAEAGMFGWECERKNIHIEADLVYVEILSDDGQAAAPGAEGNVVLTTLRSPVVPLVRYQIGDKARQSNGECSCGSGLPFISSLTGRTATHILTRDGRLVSEYYVIDRIAAHHISDFQVIQRVPGQLIVIVSEGVKIPERIMQSLQDDISRYLREDTKLNFISTGTYIFTDNGKRNTMVRDVCREEIQVV